MGRYRELVRALVYYSNSSNRSVLASKRSAESAGLSMHEYQVLEYICEFEQENRIMTDISRDTGIAQSIITKATKTLLSRGLAERYRLGSNRKSIVLRPTEAGREQYIRLSSGEVSPAFDAFFQALEGFSAEDLARFGDAVRLLANDWAAVGQPPAASPELTKIEE